MSKDKKFKLPTTEAEYFEMLPIYEKKQFDDIYRMFRINKTYYKSQIAEYEALKKRLPELEAGLAATFEEHLKEHYPELLKQAVCALIYRGDKMVGVSRRDNHNAFGLVGGKVDAGETPEEALVREVFEETGLKVTSFEKIFTRIDGVFICYTYLCQADGEISNQNEVGKDSGIGKVAEVTWEDLFAGPFGDYNKQLYTHLNSK